MFTFEFDETILILCGGVCVWSHASLWWHLDIQTGDGWKLYLQIET